MKWQTELLQHETEWQSEEHWWWPLGHVLDSALRGEERRGWCVVQEWAALRVTNQWLEYCRPELPSPPVEQWHAVMQASHPIFVFPWRRDVSDVIVSTVMLLLYCTCLPSYGSPLPSFRLCNRDPVSKHIPHKSTAVFTKTFLI
jgi:hypothetical protein